MNPAVAPASTTTANRPAWPIVLQFALDYEAKPFLRQVTEVRRIEDAPCDAIVCRHGEWEFIVLITGMGQDAAHGALAWLLERIRPSMVISCGFAGALAANVRPGMIVVPDEVIESADLRWACSANLRVVDGDMGGRLISVPFPLLTAKEKAKVGWKFQAVAVDMESAAIAELCEMTHTPFCAVRVISDSMNTRVPKEFFDVIDGSRAKWQMVMRLILRRPWLLGKLIRMGLHGNFAAKRLSKFLVQNLFPVHATSDSRRR